MPEQGWIYRVVSIRVGQRRKVTVYATLKGAQRRLMLLGPEPWRALGRDPDALWCCLNSRECSCEGVSVREAMERDRATLPVLVDAWIEARAVGPWSKVDGNGRDA